MGKKVNIIFSDFLDTLVGPVDGLSLEECGQILQKFWLDYLVNDNYFVIISSCDHFSPELFCSYLNDCTDLLDDSHKSRLFYVMTRMRQKSNINFTEINGFYLNLLKTDDKAEAVDFALGSIFKDYKINKLLAAGDSATDISMLSKIYDLGGKSVLFPNFTTVSCYEDFMDRYTTIDELYSECLRYETMYYYPLMLEKFEHTDDNLKIFKEYKKWRASRYLELQTLYNEGKMTKEQLTELVVMYYMAESYQFFTGADENEKFVEPISYKEATDVITKKMTLVKNREEIFNFFNSEMK